MEDFETMTPASAALGQLKKKKLGMSQPAGNAPGGLEFMVDPNLAPEDIKAGEEVLVRVTVTKIGTEISMTPLSVERVAGVGGEEEMAEEAAELADEAAPPSPAGPAGGMEGRFNSPTGNITARM